MTKSMMFCVLLVASLWRVAHACSCRPDQTLEQKYQFADHVLIAKISGCAPDRLSEDGSCGRHGWTFETIENLKGSDAQVRALPSDKSQGGSTCDISLKVGDTYLLFLQDGRSYQCSGTASLSGEGGTRTQSAVEILRAYRDGATTRIVDPWSFSDTGWQCGIGHMLDGGVHMSFSYAYSAPPAPLRSGAGPLPKPSPTMSLRSLQPLDFVGPTRVEVKGETVSLTRRTIRLPDARTFSIDTLQGDEALALLEKLVQPVELVVSGSRSRPGDAAERFRATTNTAQLADPAARFKACVAAHPAAGNIED